MGTPSFFSIIFMKVDNFCDLMFTFLGDKALIEGGQLLKENICS